MSNGTEEWDGHKDTTEGKFPSACISLDLLGDLTPSQIEVIKRIRREAISNVNLREKDLAKVERLKIDKYGKRIRINILVVRTDCDRYSPRCILTEVAGTFIVGKRGGIEVETHFPEKKKEELTKKDLKRSPLIFGFRVGY